MKTTPNFNQQEMVGTLSKPALFSRKLFWKELEKSRVLA